MIYLRIANTEEYTNTFLQCIILISLKSKQSSIEDMTFLSLSQTLYKDLLTSIIDSSSMGVIVSGDKQSYCSFWEFDIMSGESTGAVFMKINPSYIT